MVDLTDTSCQCGHTDRRTSPTHKARDALYVQVRCGVRCNQHPSDDFRHRQLQPGEFPIQLHDEHAGCLRDDGPQHSALEGFGGATSKQGMCFWYEFSNCNTGQIRRSQYYTFSSRAQFPKQPAAMARSICSQSNRPPWREASVGHLTSARRRRRRASRALRRSAPRLLTSVRSTPSRASAACRHVCRASPEMKSVPHRVPLERLHRVAGRIP